MQREVFDREILLSTALTRREATLVAQWLQGMEFESL